MSTAPMSPRALPLTLALALTLAVSGLLAPSASAVELRSAFKGSDARVTDKHLEPSLTGREHAYDKYLFEAFLADGRTIYWSAQFSNLGVGDGKASAKSRIDGKGVKRRRAKDTAKRGGYKAEGGPLVLEIGEHSMSGTPDKLRVTASAKDYSFDLTIEPEVAGWHPGAGKMAFSDGSYYDKTVVMPRGKVTGKVTLDGVETTVTGFGYVDHTHADVALHEQAKRWVKFRAIDGASIIYFWQFLPPSGGEPLSWLYVARKGKKVLSATSAEVTFADFSPDPKSDKGYQVPAGMVIKAKSGGTSVLLAVKAQGNYRRTDELAKLSSLERAVASKFAHPVRYAHRSTYKLVVSGAGAYTESGRRGRYEITHFNP